MTDSGLVERAKAFTQLVVSDIDAPELDRVDEHHMIKVLRIRDGADVAVTNGRGSWRMATWSSGRLNSESPVRFVDKPPPLTVGFSPLKSDRTELAAQKATELGAQRLVILNNLANSVVRWDAKRKDKAVTRLERIVREAVMQSRRVWIPRVVLMNFDDALQEGACIADIGASELVGKQEFVLIGPEGGWSPEERSMAGDRLVGLGDSVLRAETAVMATVAHMQATHL